MTRPAVALLALVLVGGAGAQQWIDGRELPLEGKAFADVEAYYDRMPASAQTTNTNAGVQWLKHHTAGMVFRFKTTSPTLAFRWSPYYDVDGPQSMSGCRYNGALGMAHMPAIGVSGIDVYVQGGDGRWNYLKSGFIYASVRKGEPSVGTIARFPLAPGTPIMVHLPLYNGLKRFEVEVADGARIEPLPPRRSGIVKPVVFYGTSITQGGCASRPGLAFSNIIGRQLDVPTVNLGFSGHGCMEPGMADYLARIDASCYVLDCLWNMDTSATPDRRPSCAGRHVDVNYEPLMRKLRAAHPDVPIVMAEQCSVFGGEPGLKDRIVRALYEKLTAEGWRNLVYLPKKGMYSGDREGTVDGCHPNDRGMEQLATAFGEAVRKALSLADAPVVAAAAAARPVKCLLHGWEFSGVTPDEIADHADQFDRLPSSGVAVYVKRDLPDGSRLTCQQIMGDGNWTRGNVAAFIPALRRFAAHRGLADSMLTFRATTTNHIAWTDDAAWARAGDNLAVLAWLTKEGGIKGLVMDGEDYSRTQQFVHRYTGGKDPPYALATELARRRGREVFAKAFAAHPSLTLLCYQFLTQHPRYQDHRDPTSKARDWGDLFPAFCNGILDALPPTAKIVDGCENSGYGCCTVKADRRRFGDFFKQAAYQMGGALALAAPENRRRYRAQTSVSFGMYLDGCFSVTNESYMYHHGPLEGSRLRHFEQDFAQACQAADEYVWLWGERGRWVDWRDVKWRDVNTLVPWEKQAPGIVRAIAHVLRPERAILDARDDLKAAGAYTNLVAGLAFRRRFAGEREGRIEVSVPHVTPGARYGVIALRKGQGEELAPKVRWLKGGKTLTDLCELTLSLPEGEGEWRWRTCAATVPEGADGMQVRFDIRQAPTETYELRELEVFRLDR